MRMLVHSSFRMGGGENHDQVLGQRSRVVLAPRTEGAEPEVNGRFGNGTPAGDVAAPHVVLVGSGRLNLRLPLMRRLRGSGFRVTAVGQDDHHAEFVAEEFEYVRYPLQRSVNPLADRRATQSLAGIFRRLQPDLIHSFNTKPNYLATLAARAVPAAVVTRTVTGMGAAFSDPGLAASAFRCAYRRMQKRIDRRARLHAFQNPDDQAYFAEHGLIAPEHGRLIRSSGIDLSAFQPPGDALRERAAAREELGWDDGFTVIMIARLIRTKGVLDFVAAAERLQETYPTMRFVLVGAPMQRGPQALSTEAINGSSAVNYLGPRDDIPVLLRAADCCVLPSYFREGVPRVLLEAGASGLPLITTDMPGCREVVHDGVNGFLHQPRDVDALVSAIERLVTDPIRASRMGQASRALVEREFSIDRVASQYCDFFREALSQGSR